MGLLLDEIGDLVTQDKEEARVLSALFAAVFTSEASSQKPG